MHLGLPMPPAYLNLTDSERTTIATGINYGSGACGILNTSRVSRIKKIMQADEDVGKIALAVPVLVLTKALELFLQDLCDRTYEVTQRSKDDEGIASKNMRLTTSPDSQVFLWKTPRIFNCVFSTIASSEESTHLKFGLDHYWLIRKVLGIVPSRQCLDFLLTACANAKDLQNIRKIWKEYQLAGYPFNVFKLREGECLSLEQQIYYFTSTVTTDLPKQMDQNKLHQHLAKSIFLISVGPNDYNVLANQNITNRYTPPDFADDILGELSNHIEVRVLYIP
ncbi:hypothetical protein K1719_028782 [Acacia pycnantha]|nr:hypothetical protein K1719_028782 [Acacia pycnantha]